MNIYLKTLKVKLNLLPSSNQPSKKFLIKNKIKINSTKNSF